MIHIHLAVEVLKSISERRPIRRHALDQSLQTCDTPPLGCQVSFSRLKRMPRHHIISKKTNAIFVHFSTH